MLPKPPYYAVIFTSRKFEPAPGYDAVAARMEELAATQPGFLGLQSARGSDGFGITVSYWQSEEDIARWKAEGEHRAAQAKGRAEWYEGFEVRITKVEKAYSFGQSLAPDHP